MSSTTLNRLDQSATDGKLGLLGYVVWFGLPDVSIQPSQLAALAAGIGLTDTPDMGARADAFRRATTTRSRRGENRSQRYLMRPVCDTGDTIVRHLIVESVDSNNVKLGHAAVVEVSFDKPSGQLVWKTLDASLVTTEVGQITKEIEEAFAEYTTALSGGSIQRWVMRKLDAMSRVTVHPNGAVYFIPAARGDEARKVQKLVRGLVPFAKVTNEVPSFTVLPVYDAPEQRADIKAGLTSAVQTDLIRMTAELAELLHRPSKPDTVTVEHRMSQIGSVMAKVKEYEAVVGESLDQMKVQVEIVMTQAEALLDKANSQDDALITLAKQEDEIEVTYGETKRVATIVNRLNPTRQVSIRFNGDGWTVAASHKVSPIEELRGRSEFSSGTNKWSVRTADPEVAMLFVRSALRLPAA